MSLSRAEGNEGRQKRAHEGGDFGKVNRIVILYNARGFLYIIATNRTLIHQSARMRIISHRNRIQRFQKNWLSKSDRHRARTGQERWALEPLNRSEVENESRKAKPKETIKCRKWLESAGSSGDERNTPLSLKGDKPQGSANVSQSCTSGVPW